VVVAAAVPGHVRQAAARRVQKFVSGRLPTGSVDAWGQTVTCP
jgi:hypothetical protein